MVENSPDDESCTSGMHNGCEGDHRSLKGAKEIWRYYEYFEIQLTSSPRMPVLTAVGDECLFDIVSVCNDKINERMKRTLNLSLDLRAVRVGHSAW